MILQLYVSFVSIHLSAPAVTLATVFFPLQRNKLYRFCMQHRVIVGGSTQLLQHLYRLDGLSLFFIIPGYWVSIRDCVQPVIIIVMAIIFWLAALNGSREKGFHFSPFVFSASCSTGRFSLLQMKTVSSSFTERPPVYNVHSLVRS